jgi:hypothetical protein
VLPWALLVVGGVASLAANVAVAEPTATGRVIAAWPSFALIAAYELLMRQVRRSATGGVGQREPSPRPQPAPSMTVAASRLASGAGSLPCTKRWRGKRGVARAVRRAR